MQQPFQPASDRDQFAPPRPPGRSRAVALAVLAHLALIGALTWGVRWKGSDDAPAMQAELWSATAQQAAPRAVAPPPAPAPAPPPRAAAPDTREADIALEREKKRLEDEKKRRQQQQQEREQRERERRDEERRERLEQEKKERLAQQKAEQKAEREKAQREKAEREKAEQQKAQQEKARHEKAEREKAEREKAERQKAERAEQEQKKKAAEEKRAEELRKEQLRRIAGLAGATGSDNATGSAARSSGPGGGAAARGAACCAVANQSSACMAGASSLPFQRTPQVSAPISARCASTASATARERPGGRGGANWSRSLTAGNGCCCMRCVGTPDQPPLLTSSPTRATPARCSAAMACMTAS